MRILVVEDEHRIANSLKKGLEQERHVVDVEYDGAAGYAQASEEEYDLIILDLMLPEMDGLTVSKKLREKQIKTPILMLTAKDQIHDKVTGLDVGADDYMVKPFAFEELLARIRALMRRPPRHIDDILKVGDLSLDSRTFAVARAGESIKLSQKEYALLEYLMREAPHVVSKEQIIHHVWDYDADILPNTIEAFIKNLRKKIDHAFAPRKALIQTVRGFGYKLSDQP